MVSTELTVAINGNTYTEEQINAMDRASLRTIARILQETKFPDVSRAWIGSMASTSDLRDFVLGRPVRTDHTGTLNGNATPSNASTNGDAVELLQQAISAISANARGGATQAQIDEVNQRLDHKLAELEAKFSALLANSVQTVKITVNETEVARADGLRHKDYDDLLADIVAFKASQKTEKANFWLVGPAGTGKTTAAKKIAEQLGLPFFFNGAIDSEYKLSGFIDAQGRVIATPFRRAYSEGGVYLFDEVDSSLPSACLAFNAALANGECDFPGAERPVERHPDCIILAASNTWGGPSGDYVGRFKQDGAFMDRFKRVPWETDEKFETALCANKRWVGYVQQVRKAVIKHGVQAIVSPRASLA